MELFSIFTFMENDMRSLLFCLLAVFSAASLSANAHDTLTTASGLKYVIVKKGKGRKAQPGEFILAHYTGFLSDGTTFDSSRERDHPFVFQLGKRQVIKGWDEGFALLHVGDRALLIIPPDLAYGEYGTGDDIGPNATLTFDVEFLDVKTATLGSVLTEEFEKNGCDEALKKFRVLKSKKYGDLYVNEDDINRLGYSLLQKGKVNDAIIAFQINVEAFPDSFNAYDSLGEAYMAAGNKELSAQNYEYSLKLNPDNENAVIMLKKLQQ